MTELDLLLIAIEQSTNIDEQELKCRKAGMRIRTIRGCYYYMAKKMNIPMLRAAKRIDRLHGTAIITSQHYSDYIDTHDKYVLDFLNAIKGKINELREKEAEIQ